MKKVQNKKNTYLIKEKAEKVLFKKMKNTTKINSTVQDIILAAKSCNSIYGYLIQL